MTIIESGDTAYHDEVHAGRTQDRDNEIRIWNPQTARMEWVTDGSGTYCPGFRRERYGTFEEGS